MAFNHSHILYRTFSIYHGFTGRSHFRSICPSKGRYLDRRIARNGYFANKLLHTYVIKKYQAFGMLIYKQGCPYSTLWAIRRSICTSQNKNPATFNILLYNRKCHSIRFLTSYGKRSGRKLYKKTRNHFDILEVTPNSHKTEIKKSFYRLSKQYHPDMNKSDEAAVKFSEISAAYEILKDPTKRRLYERGIQLPRDRHTSPEDMSKHKSGTESPEEYFNNQINDKPRFRRRAISQDNDFWYYYASMKDSRKASHEDLEKVLKRYREEEKYRRTKGLLGGTVVLAFLLAIFFWK